MKDFFNNLFWSGAKVSGGILLSIVLTPIIIGHLGIDGFGQWVYLQLFSYMGFVQLADLGTQGVLVRVFLSDKARHLNAYFLSSVIGLSVFCIFAYCLFEVLVVRLFIEPSDFLYSNLFALRILIVSSLIRVVVTPCTALILSKNKISAFEAFSLWARFSYFGAAILGLSFNASLLALSLALSASFLVETILLIVWTIKSNVISLRVRRVFLSGTEARHLLSFCMANSLQKSFGLGFNRSPQIIVFSFVGDDVLGIFRLLILFGDITKNIDAIWLKVFSIETLKRTFSKSPSSFDVILIAGSTLFLWNVWCLVFLTYFGPQIIQLWVGISVDEYIPILFLILFMRCLVSIQSAPAQSFLNVDHMKKHSWLNLFCLLSLWIGAYCQKEITTIGIIAILVCLTAISTIVLLKISSTINPKVLSFKFLGTMFTHGLLGGAMGIIALVSNHWVDTMLSLFLSKNMAFGIASALNFSAFALLIFGIQILKMTKGKVL